MTTEEYTNVSEIRVMGEGAGPTGGSLSIVRCKEKHQDIKKYHDEYSVPSWQGASLFPIFLHLTNSFMVLFCTLEIRF